MLKSKRLLLAFSLISSLFTFSLHAANWQSSFFTDDSDYYLKLRSDGFTQRFRVEKSACNQIKDADVVFNRAGGYITSEEHPIPTFYLKDAEHKYEEVFVAGDFNEWEPEEIPMVYNKETGYWEHNMKLPYGEHAYKFIIDGEWVVDYFAKKFVTGGFGFDDSVIIIDKNKIKKNNPRVSFKKMTSSDLKKWKDLHALDNKDLCWYQVSVRGIDLNKPMDNQYVIKLDTRSSSKPFYFAGLSDSLIPQDRLTQKLEHISWINLGGFGPNIVEDGGVFYKVWEPRADKVHLFQKAKGFYVEGVTPFKKMIPNYNERLAEKRSFSLYDPEAKQGDDYHYQYWKWYQYDWMFYGNDYVMSPVKIDPMAKEVKYTMKGGDINGYINARSIVNPPSNYVWKYDENAKKIRERDFNNWIIYQVWPLTFNPKKKNNRYALGTFKGVTEKVNYIADLGVNAVEFLPIHESRFHVSWGYGMDSLILLETNLGSRNDFKELVDELHGKDIRVILDVVLNHINNNLTRDPLQKLEEIGQTKFYRDENQWGPVPRFERIMVRKYIADSLISLIRDYHIDGFRFDMTHYIHGGRPEGYQFLQTLNQLLRKVSPFFNTSAEELPDNVWATKSAKENGMAFDSQWNDKFKNFFEHKFDGYRAHSRGVDLNILKSALEGFSNHRHYHGEYNFGSPNTTVNYLSSHDFIGNKNPFLRIISDYQGTEELFGNTYSRVRPLTDPEPEKSFREIHDQFTHATGKTAYGVLFTKPGQILFFQGEELANDTNIENEWSYLNPDEEGNPQNMADSHKFLTSHVMPWEYYYPTNNGPLAFLDFQEKNLMIGYNKYFKELIKLRKNHPDINFLNAHNVQVSYNGSVISYELNAGKDRFFVIANFGYPNDGMWIHFPGLEYGKWWTEAINSSSRKFGDGTDRFKNVVSHIGGRNNLIRMNGPAISIFKSTNKPNITEDLFLRGDMNKWRASTGSRLKPDSHNPNAYSCEFTVKQGGHFNFKLASANWDISVGIDAHKDGQFLSYFPQTQNGSVYLSKGKYKFYFYLDTFGYSFVKK